MQQLELEEASTHKSVMTHAGNVLCHWVKLLAPKKTAVISSIGCGEKPT